MEYTINTIVFGDWHITKELGAGAYGKVFEIEKTSFGITTKSALKVITIPSSGSDIRDAISEGMDEKSVTSYFKGYVQQIVKEISLLSTLKACPNVVNYEDHCVIEYPDEIRWDVLLRMELLTPLTNYMIKNAVTEEEVRKLGMDICRALVECEKHGIIHRDIKPDNIFMDELGNYKLGDFGVSRTMEKTTGASKKGTEVYMAPEVYMNQPYGKTVDIYSLGLVMYRLLNGGRLPFYPPYPNPITFSDKENAMIRRMKGEEFPVPTRAGEGMVAIIRKACAFKVEDRYRSAGEMLQAMKSLGDSTQESMTQGMSWQKPNPQTQNVQKEEQTASAYVESVQPEEEKTASPWTEIPVKQKVAPNQTSEKQNVEKQNIDKQNAEKQMQPLNQMSDRQNVGNQTSIEMEEEQTMSPWGEPVPHRANTQQQTGMQQQSVRQQQNVAQQQSVRQQQKPTATAKRRVPIAAWLVLTIIGSFFILGVVVASVESSNKNTSGNKQNTTEIPDSTFNPGSNTSGDMQNTTVLLRSAFVPGIGRRLSQDWQLTLRDTGVATESVENGRLIITISDVGGAPASVDLHTDNIVFEQGGHYRLTIDMKCQDMKYVYVYFTQRYPNNDFLGYWAEECRINSTDMTRYVFDFYMGDNITDEQGSVSLCLGCMDDGIESYEIEFDNIVLQKID